MPFRIFFLLVFTLVVVSGSAQTKTDTLHLNIVNASRKGDQGALANAYAQLAYHYIINNKYDSAIFYYQRSIKTEPVSTDVNLLASNYNGIGSVYNYLGVKDSSLYYYDRALTIYTTVRDTLRSSYVEINMAMIYKEMAVFDKALEYALRAIERLEQLEDWNSLSTGYNTVSLLYVQLKDFEKGLEYAYRTLELRRKVNSKTGIGQSYNNIGEIFLNQGLYDSALVKFTQALKIKRENNDRRTFSSTIANLGTTLFHKGRMQEAEARFLEALELKKEFTDRVGEAEAYNNLARIALHNRNTSRAEELLLKAEAILIEMKSPEFRLENLELLVRCSEMSNKFPLAVRYLHELVLLKDSVLAKDKLESMNALQVRFDTERKEQRILLLEEQAQVKASEMKIQKAMIYGLGAGVALLLIIAGLIFTNFRIAKNGKENVEILLRELHHRVKNNLQLLSSVLNLQSQQLTDESALVAVRSNESRVNAMALIHRKLYAGARNRAIGMRDYVKELTEFLLYSYGYGEEKLKMITEVDDVEVDVDKAIPLGLILNEVISNSLKYAFHEQADPLIRITLKITPAKELFVEIHDNGKGFVNEVTAGSEQSFGLKMINLLTKELHGTIRVVGENGTSVYIKIPLK